MTDIIIDCPRRYHDSDQIDSNASLPKVSFCIPTYNNEDTLKGCLQSYSMQNYPDFEIIVVDNGSTDSTVDIAEEYADIIKFDRGGIGSVRKKSIEVASGEILGLFDSDVVLPHENWLRNAVRCFEYSEAISTVWPENVAPPDAPPTTRTYFLLWHVIEENRIKTDRGPFGGGNSLFRREALEAVGGVDESLDYVEDLDWAKRLRDAGFKVVYLRDPIYHYTMLGFGRFARKQFMAADRFTRAGGEITGLPVTTIIYEQTVLGIIGMVKGLVFNRDPDWLLFLPMLVVRAIAFGYTLLRIGLERATRMGSLYK